MRLDVPQIVSSIGMRCLGCCGSDESRISGMLVYFRWRSKAKRYLASVVSVSSIRDLGARGTWPG